MGTQYWNQKFDSPEQKKPGDRVIFIRSQTYIKTLPKLNSSCLVVVGLEAHTEIEEVPACGGGEREYIFVFLTRLFSPPRMFILSSPVGPV